MMMVTIKSSSLMQLFTLPAHVTEITKRAMYVCVYIYVYIYIYIYIYIHTHTHTHIAFEIKDIQS
jgi:hypothetical protein